MGLTWRDGLMVSASCVFLCGCAPTAPIQPYVIETAYRDSDFKPYGAPGSATLTGQAFLKTVGGDVKTCAGNKVTLAPATAYNLEALSHLSSLPVTDPRAKAAAKTAICDAEGKFEFDSVPPLKWIVVTLVTWGVPQVEDGIFGPVVNTEEQGGALTQIADLKPGHNRVILTDVDRVHPTH